LTDYDRFKLMKAKQMVCEITNEVIIARKCGN